MPLNCGGGDWTPQRVVSPLDCKEIQPVHPKGNQSWIFIGRTDAEAENSNTLATWYEELTHWKRPWCWERLKVGGEGDDRGWDGWLVPPIWWTWVWVSSRSWWWTGKPGVLQSMGSQRVRHDWVTELNWGCDKTVPQSFSRCSTRKKRSWHMFSVLLPATVLSLLDGIKRQRAFVFIPFNGLAVTLSVMALEESVLTLHTQFSHCIRDGGHSGCWL